MLTAPASTSPMRRPASRTVAIVSASPARTSAVTSAIVRTSLPLPHSSRSSAVPLATESTQSKLPQRHSTPPPSITGMCPISPAAPIAPRRMPPPAITPAPMRVEIFTNIRSSSSG